MPGLMPRFPFILTRRCRQALLLVLALGAVSQSWAALNIVSTQGLTFGKFAAGTGGTVTISTNGARSRTGNVILLASDTGTAAAFTVSDTDPANATLTYVITLPANDTVTISSGGNSMAVNSFVSNPSGSGMLSGGSQSVTVGATLTVGANQPAGNYTGSFSVIVDYQ
jgi:hypothetical protein